MPLKFMFIMGALSAMTLSNASAQVNGRTAASCLSEISDQVYDNHGSCSSTYPGGRVQSLSDMRFVAGYINTEMSQGRHAHLWCTNGLEYVFGAGQCYVIH